MGRLAGKLIAAAAAVRNGFMRLSGETNFGKEWYYE